MAEVGIEALTGVGLWGGSASNNKCQSWYDKELIEDDSECDKYIVGSYVELDLSSNLEAPLIIDDVGPVQSHRQAGQILLQHVGVLHQNWDIGPAVHSHLGCESIALVLECLVGVESTIEIPFSTFMFDHTVIVEYLEIVAGFDLGVEGSSIG